MSIQKLTLVLLAAAFAAQGGTRLILTDGWKFKRHDASGTGSELTLPVMAACLDNMGRDLLKNPPASRAWPAGDPGEGLPYTKETFNDSAWRSVCLPHDWVIESDFSFRCSAADGFLPTGGVGWYRRTLEIPAADAGKRVYLDFDGAMSYSMVWINGRFVGGWPYGYTSFRVDLTPFIKFGGKNILAVRLENPEDSSRWYTGAGLYRHVYLVTADPVHIDYHGVYVTTPAVTDAKASVKVAVKIQNTLGVAKRVKWSLSLKAPGEKESVAQGGGEVEVPPGFTTVARTLAVEKPRLWSLESPALYELETAVGSERETTRFGIRSIAFFADARAFQLNGKTVRIRGVCLHHDLGALGAAFNTAAARRRLSFLREAGVNAIRMSHNQPAPELLALCDEMGFLVKDEVFDQWNIPKRRQDYSTLFPAWHERDIRAWIRSDRNHPCVIIWSLGNEIKDAHHHMDLYIATGRALSAIAREEDPTRPTTEANPYGKSGFSGFQKTAGIFGYNYRGTLYWKFREANPDIPLFGSETICTSSTRGEYFFPVTKNWYAGPVDFHLSSYDWMANDYTERQRSWACPPDDEWRDQEMNPSVMGEFVWTGFDYLGGSYLTDRFRQRPRFSDPERQRQAEEEVKACGMCKAGIHSCTTGLFDLAGFPKDRFYLYQSHWNPEKPMAHILPHWNWPERTGQVTPVYVYTTGEEAELFLNGQSLGRRRKSKYVYRMMWNEVVYEPGTLRAVAYKDGKKWAEAEIATTGPVAALAFEPEAGASPLAADGETIAFVTLSVRDAAKRVVPRTHTRVQLSLKGPGEIVGADNGDETDFDSFHSPSRRVFNGFLSVLVRAKKNAAGALVLKAESEGLPAAEVTIPLAAAPSIRQ